MLTIQPKILNNYRPAFRANENNNDFDLSNLDKDSFESGKAELLDAKKELEDLANNKEFNLPKGVNKAIKVGTTGASIGVAAMAGGFGTSKVWGGISKLLNTKFIKGITKRIRVYPKLAMKKLRNLPQFKKVTTSIAEAYEKFGTKKFGKPVVKVLNAIGNGIKYVINKVKGVKAETYKKATVNTVGASSGIATGVNMLREDKETKIKNNANDLVAKAQEIIDDPDSEINDFQILEQQKLALEKALKKEKEEQDINAIQKLSDNLKQTILELQEEGGEN